MADLEEMREYVQFKLDDEGLEGVAEHCTDYVKELGYPDVARRIDDWHRLGQQLEDLLRQLVED